MPAGTFTGARLVELTSRAGDQETAVQTWYVDGVGPVRQVTRTGTAEPVVWELKELPAVAPR